MSDGRTKIVRTTTWSAGPGCHGGCGVLAHVRDGKLIKIEGDPDHPWNQGRLCARALAMTQYVDHPERLRRPLRRVGERGQGQWEEMSWEEAFDLIEARLKAIRAESGPESVIFSMGTGRDIGPWICLLAYAFGSPNVMFALSGNACYSPRIAALDTVQGDYCVFDAGQWLPDRYQDPRFKAPEVMIIWGYNIPATCPDNLFGHWIVDMMKMGTKIITIDPRLSFFASRSKHWLQIRPGTDAALAMGFLKVILDEALFDPAWVERWTNAAHLVRSDAGRLLRESDLGQRGLKDNYIAWDKASGQPVVWDSAMAGYKSSGIRPALSGKFTVDLAGGGKAICRTVWDRLREEVDKYPLEEVEKITGVPAGEIQAAARLYAQAKPGAIHWGVPIDMTPAITPLCQAIATLWAITGNLDKPGGNVFSRFAFNAVAYALPGAEGIIKLKDRDQDRPRIGRDYGPFGKFIWRTQTDRTLEQLETGSPYPIRGLWIQTCNILGNIGLDPRRWREALRKVEFIVAVDLFHNATTQYADVVLPAATFLEKNGVRSWWVPLQSINKALTVPECRSDAEINFELARRFDPDLKWAALEDLYNDIIKPSGLTYGELQERVFAFAPQGHPSVPYDRHEKGLLRPDGRPGFNTPTGLFELWSTLREDWGLAPLPHHEEPPYTPVSRPDLAREYPLILSTGRRSPAFFHSEHRNIPWLRHIDPDPVVEIHPETAARYDIGPGEWVWLENWLGRAKFKAKVTYVVPPWLVMAAHAWWLPEKNGAEPELYGTWEHNVNQLIPMGDQGQDGLGAPIKHSLCKIYKAEPGEVSRG